MRRTIIAGNWKMNTNHDEAVSLASALRGSSGPVDQIERVVIPPFPWIIPVEEAVRGSGIQLGAQNCYIEPSGAYTGEVSPDMLVGHCQYVLAGHSERRHVLGESDAFVAAKVEAIRRAGLSAILCVGETLDERENGNANNVVSRQVEAGLSSISSADMEHVVIAYEPVWAIGTGKAASADDAQEMSAFIRARLADMYDDQRAEGTSILYGGSVSPDNIAELMALPDVDGALVGGASLKADAFTEIARVAANAN